jgi:hypothetical protein
MCIDTSPCPAGDPRAVAPDVSGDEPPFIVTSDGIRRIGRPIACVAPLA